MSGNAPSRTVRIAALVALALAGACGSSPASRFYTLSPDEAAPFGGGQVTGPAIALGPVSVPEYLDRPQIATRKTRHELSLAEYDRWAGSFGQNVEIALAENLSAALRKQGVTVLREAAASQRPVPVRCRVGVDIRAFEADAEGRVVLEAWWTIYDAASGKEGFVGQSVVTEPGSGTGYAGIVAAMSRALAALGRDIAQALVSRGYAP
ncbi:MAG: PqiC family protein [Planctomycetes bacterium]|jgi:hypothetical protein|nr:PqiC family protein [Planctomycetota bacterium]